MFVKVGTAIPVEDLIRGIIINSGNDACVVVAQALGGTVEGFVRMMNQRAKELGLEHSHFVNPDGLPEPPGQLMSARDLAVLARNIIIALPAILSLLQRARLHLERHPPDQPQHGAGKVSRRGRTEDRPHRCLRIWRRRLRRSQGWPAPDPGARAACAFPISTNIRRRRRTGSPNNAAAKRPRACWARPSANSAPTSCSMPMPSSATRRSGRATKTLCRWCWASRST